MTPPRILSNREKGPDLHLACSQTEEYLKYHHRNFVQQQMEKEAEIHIGALDWAPKVKIKSGKNENMSKEVKAMMVSSSETVYLS